MGAPVGVNTHAPLAAEVERIVSNLMALIESFGS
jgi:hypothetical protein